MSRATNKIRVVRGAEQRIDVYGIGVDVRHLSVRVKAPPGPPQASP